MTSSGDRPDPDALLARVNEAQAREKAGRLRIYFGSSAGVGKTYAMLGAAQRARGEGRDVAVGIVETHGRGETAALLDGLDLVPLRQVPWRDRSIAEFDLDATLARRPALVLVDELAHSNAPGSRHPKRWQDVQELLAAGIDVWSTLNVQHLESLNEVVGGITGVRVLETVPDRVLDIADEVILVDLTVDELLARLAQGKVYVPQQAERAAANFFRKGNLIALRELALRRVAERIGGDVQAYRSERSISRIWQTGEAILACIGPREGAESILRGAARWAGQLEADWHAVYVETPALQRLPPAQRDRILRVLQLAESLGARTAVLAGADVSGALAAYARKHNVGRVALGRAPAARSRWHATGKRLSHLLRPPMRERLARALPEADLIEVSGDGGPARPLPAAAPRSGVAVDAAVQRSRRRIGRYLQAAAVVGVGTVLALPLSRVFDLANIVMLFLLAVVLVGYRFGRGPAVMASVLAVGLFDFFFVPPQLSFAVSDVQYLLTFVVMLVVGLVTGQLTAGLRYQARVAEDRETRARELYELARELSGAVMIEQIDEHARPTLSRALQAESWLLLPDEKGVLRPTSRVPDAGGGGAVLDLAIAQWTYDQSTPSGFATDTLPSSPIRYLPLRAPMRTRGVLAVHPSNPRWLLIPERQRQLETIANLIAIALERVHYVEVAQRATVRIESEQLRNSLLSAISHDLRTPLTALVGWADVLEMSKPPMTDEQQRIAHAIADEARRTGRLVENLLEMARLESGALAPRLQWQSIEEIVGSAVRSVRAALAEASVRVTVPAGLPLVRCDAVLIERVLANLLENAAKYGRSAAGSEPATIDLEAAVADGELWVTVSDRGGGLPPRFARQPDGEGLFEKFTRGDPESSVPGLGLGLSISRAIVAAHGGRVWARNREGGGAVFGFSLKLDDGPVLDMPDGADIHATPGPR